MKSSRALPTAIALALLLSACGNKGPLLRPAPDTPPAPPADAVPAMDDPTEAGEPEQIMPPPADPPSSQLPEAPPSGEDGDG